MSQAGQLETTVSAPAALTAAMFFFIVSAKTSHLPATSIGVPQQFSKLPRAVKSGAAAAPILSRGGKVILLSSWISLPRSFIQLGSMGRAAEQRWLQSSQVVQTKIVSTIFWSQSTRPSWYSRSQYHLPRGDWLSPPRP